MHFNEFWEEFKNWGDQFCPPIFINENVSNQSTQLVIAFFIKADLVKKHFGVVTASYSFTFKPQFESSFTKTLMQMKNAEFLIYVEWIIFV